MKLGKKPARPDAVKLKFSNYFDTNKLPTPPLVFGHYRTIRQWGVLGNNDYGDCVFAGAAHETMLWHSIGNKNVDMFDTQAVLENYSEVTGFNPDDPDSDQGTDMQQAASYRKHVGLLDSVGERHKINSYVAIHAGGLDHMIVATYLFGATGTGVLFPRGAEKQFKLREPWHIGGDGLIEGGHYVPLVGRKGNGNLVVITWGREQEVTPEWWERYNDENIVYLSDDMLEHTHDTTPEGLDWDALKKDLQTIQREGQRP